MSRAGGKLVLCGSPAECPQGFPAVTDRFTVVVLCLAVGQARSRVSGNVNSI